MTHSLTTKDELGELSVAEALRKLKRGCIDFQADARKIVMLGRAEASANAAELERLVAARAAEYKASGNPDASK